MTNDSSTLFWIVEMKGASSSFYCPDCYKNADKRPLMRIPIRLLDDDRQCPGCSIEVQRWEKMVNGEKISNNQTIK